jgi:hypothetical protein
MFKVGDVVICVDSDGVNLTEGKIYTILHDDGHDFFQVETDSTFLNFFCSWRFKLPENVLPDPAENIFENVKATAILLTKKPYRSVEQDAVLTYLMNLLGNHNMELKIETIVTVVNKKDI